MASTSHVQTALLDEAIMWRLLVALWACGLVALALLPFRSVPEPPKGELGSIVASLRDVEGRPILDGWRLYAIPLRPRPQPQRSQVAWKHQRVCRIDDVPMGVYEVSARLDMGAQTPGRQVIVAGSEEARVDLCYEGPDPARTITLTFRVDRDFTLFPEREHIQLLGLDSEARLPSPGDQPAMPRFHDVPPGTYTISIDDPRFLLWRAEAIEPGGRRLAVRLMGSAGVRLRVVDEASGAVVSSYEAMLLPKGPSFQTRAIPLVRRAEQPPADGVFEGLVPHDYTLVVETEDHARFETRVYGLRPGETRDLDVSLVPGGVIAGFVLEHDDVTEAKDVRVQIEGYRTTSDQQGRFRFDRVPPGRYEVLARRDVDLETSISDLEITFDEVYDDLRLVLPLERFLHGRLLGPTPSMLAGMKLAVVTTKFERFETEVERDGSFRLSQVPPGPARVFLATEGVTLRPRASREIGEVSIAEGQDTEKNFELSENFPSRLDVKVRVDGKPAADLSVLAVSNDVEVDADSAASFTNEVGLAPLILFSGSWRISVSSSRGGWHHESSDIVRVAPASVEETEIDVTLIDGVMTILDEATDEPLAYHQVLVTDGAAYAYAGRTFEIDPKGRLRLSRPLGTMQVVPILPNYAAGVEVEPQTLEWTARGPKPTILRFPRP